MKKFFLTLLFILVVSVVYGQTNKELLGNWKLTSIEAEGQKFSPEEIIGEKNVFQIFKNDDVFESIAGKRKDNGTYKLSKDNKTLTITVSGKAIDFEIKKFTASERSIYNSKIGILHYVKEK